MTQMRREDDDMIELHKTPRSRCRGDTQNLSYIIPIIYHCNRCYCNDKNVNANHCNKLRGNRFMQHYIFVTISSTYCNDLF